MQHHPFMPLSALPGFMRNLEADGDEPMAQPFRTLILSGLRSNEAAGARGSEFDMASHVWTIPGSTIESRFKRWQHGDHRVPISNTMAAILDARQQLRTDDGDALVFADECGPPNRAHNHPIVPRA